MYSPNPVIRELKFVLSGTYNDIVARPYETSVTPQSLSQFVEQTRQGTSLSAQALAGVANQIIKPVTQDQGVISIPNGWGQRRMMFLMTLELDTLGCKLVHYISGYTDRDEYVKSSGHVFLPPDLTLYINTIVTVRETNQAGAFGAVMMPTLTDASHIMRGNTTTHYGRNNGMQQYGQLSMRPEDVIGRIDEMHLSGHNKNAIIVGAAPTFSNGIKCSRLANSAPTNFLSSTLTAVSDSFKVSEITDGLDQIMERARANVFDTTINSNAFFFGLRERAELFIQQGAIRWQELMEIQADIDQRKVLYEPSALSQTGNRQMQRGDTMGWDGASREVIAATILNHAVPAMMADYMLTRVGISITSSVQHMQPVGFRVNYGYGCYDVLITNIATYGNINIDLTPTIPKLAERIVRELIVDLTAQSQSRIELHAEFSLGLSENRVKIAFDGGMVYSLGDPAFCSSLSIPVITSIPNTGGPSSLDRLAHDINRLSSEITSTSSNYYGTPNNGNSSTRFSL